MYIIGRLFFNMYYAEVQGHELVMKWKAKNVKI